jgi:hypothetical protein
MMAIKDGDKKRGKLPRFSILLFLFLRVSA